MMNFLRFAVVACLFALIQGCASDAARKSNAEPPLANGAAQVQAVPPLAHDAAQVQAVHVTLTPEVQGQLYYNDSIKPGRVLGAMKRNLKARDMLGKPSDRHLPSLEIVINDIRARSSGASIWMGFLAGEDRIAGEVIVRDPSGQEIDRVSVKSTYAWGGPFGTDHERMNYLYNAFAEHAAEILTGRSLPRETLDKIASSQI